MEEAGVEEREREREREEEGGEGRGQMGKGLGKRRWAEPQGRSEGGKGPS